MEEKLFDHFTALGKIDELTPILMEKFRYACKKSVAENPELEFSHLCVACNVYLNFIKSFPTLDLGKIETPQQP